MSQKKFNGAKVVVLGGSGVGKTGRTAYHLLCYFFR